MGKTATPVTVSPFLQALALLDKKKQQLAINVGKTLAQCTPGWENVDPEDVMIQHLSGAMTNMIFSASKPDGENKDVLLRIYGEGTDLFFSREEETRIFEELGKKDIGVGLLATFGNGRVEKLIHGSTFSSKQMHQPDQSRLIAIKMQEFHQLEMNMPKEIQIFANIRNLLQVVQTHCTGSKFQNLDFLQLEKDVEEMELALSKIHSPLVFSHNDLQYGNIMLTNHGVVFIDFEYASYNPRGYDLANHFCEWAYNYHKSTNPHLGNWNHYPSKDQQRHFCRHYLMQSNQEEPESEPSEQDIEQLRYEANMFTQASHLFWGLWGFIQASQSEIDFDFYEYAMCRYNAYKSKATVQI